MRVQVPPVLKTTTTLIARTWKAWNMHSGPRIGAALAYYTTFALAPVLVITVAVAGTVFGPEAARAELNGQLVHVLGAPGAEVVDALLDNTHRGRSTWIATVIGLVTLILGASNLFAELQAALNLVWDVPRPPRTTPVDFLRTRFFSFLMVLGIGGLLLLSLVASTVLTGLQGAFPGIVTGPWLAQSVTALVTLLVSWGLFALVFKVLPDVEVSWKDVRIGAFVTAVLFGIGKLGISFYLGKSMIASTYGAAGSFAALLVWIHFSAQILLLGACFTQVYATLHGSRCPR